MARLDELLDARLGVVLGPPGAGKTNLMARWAQQAPVDVVWHRATPRDADPAELVRRLGDALRPLAPGRPPARDVDGLLAAIADHRSPLVLAIDDLQLADRPPVVAALQNLLLDAPDHLHMLLGSRRAPGLNLARTELSSIVVAGQELRLRSDETARLFREVYRTPLSTRDAVQITRRTEGWAAAIRLLHLSISGLPVPERHAAIRALGDRARYAGGYLTHQVLVGLPADVLDFLRETSVLPRLTPDRCDRLLGTDDAHGALRAAEPHLGLLVSRRNGASYQLHPVVRSHLITELRDAWGDARVAQHYRRAAAILAADGHPVEAARALAAAEDWSGLREILASDGALVAGARDPDWLDRLPDRVVAGEPWLQLARAHTALQRGSLAEAVRLAETTAPAGDAGQEVALLREDLRHFAVSWTSGDVQPGASWGEQLRVVVRRPRLDRRGWPGLPHAESGLLRSIELTVLGDLVAARRLLAGSVPELDPNTPASMAGRLLAVAHHAFDPAAADNLAHRAEEFGMPWFARMARGVAAAAEYALGGTDAIGDPLAHAIADSDRLEDAWGAALLTALRCLALVRAGRPAEADFEDVASRFRALDAPALEAWARAGLALTTSTQQLPEARRAAEIAVGFARSAGTPGALAISYAALGLAGGRDRDELLAMAQAEAEAAGLDVLPWTWAEELPHVPWPRSSEHAGHTSDAEPQATRPPIRTETAPVVDIRCFARFEFRIGGTAPSLARVRPRAREVLRLLSLHAGHSVHRETLVDTLWRDLDPAAGTHNLHVCVSSLRAALEPGVRREERALIVRDGDRYLLPLVPGSRSDVRTFDEAVAAADRHRAEGDADATIVALERAVATYTGEVLPEDGPAEWVVAARDRYRMRAADAAVLLAELRLTHREPDAASAAALRGIDIDPCRDSAWRLLIRASHAAGDLAAAERARRSYADVLASLGVVSDSAAAVRPPPDSGG